jgi:2-polyprenyl-6-methoxyphenol hydroxylase-like FAD-dependent oxidoreductase
MKHIGVYDRLKEIGNSYEELNFSNAQGTRLATFLNGGEQLYGCKAMRIHRREVQRVLVEEVQAQGIEIQHGMKLKSIQETEAEIVELNFENGQKVQAHLVIGTDGLHSLVRRYVAPDSETSYAHMIGITGFLPRDNLHPSVESLQLPNMFFGQNGFIAVMPSDVTGSEIGFFSTMDYPEERSRQEWDQLFEDKEMIRTIIRGKFCKENGWNQVVDGICQTANGATLCSWP